MAGNKWCWLASRSIRFDSGKVCDFGGRCLDSKHPNSACRVITLSWSPWFYFSSLCSLACVQGGGSWGKYDTGRYWFYMRNVRWGLVIRVTRCLISLSPANQYKAVCYFPEWEDDALLVYNRRCMNWHRETIIPAVVVRILEHKSVFNFFIYFFFCVHTPCDDYTASCFRTLHLVLPFTHLLLCYTTIIVVPLYREKPSYLDFFLRLISWSSWIHYRHIVRKYQIQLNFCRRVALSSHRRRLLLEW